MSGGNREDDETKAVFAVDAPSDEEAPDSSLEVEPEVITPVANRSDGKAKAHAHPPPPPRIRAGEARPLSVTGEPKLARDLMTRQLFTIGPEDKLQSLEEHMESLKFRHLPVVDGEKLVGLISWADLLHASSSFLSEVAKQRDEIIHKLPAKRIMRTEMTTVRPTETLAAVAEVMWKAHAECVLVTEGDAQLVGIITQADFVRLAHHFLSAAGR